MAVVKTPFDEYPAETHEGLQQSLYQSKRIIIVLTDSTRSPLNHNQRTNF